jgi:hypothetical protein
LLFACLLVRLRSLLHCSSKLRSVRACCVAAASSEASCQRVHRGDWSEAWHAACKHRVRCPDGAGVVGEPDYRSPRANVLGEQGIPSLLR